MKKFTIATLAVLAFACAYAKILKLEIPPVNQQGTPVPIKVSVKLDPKGENPSPEVPDGVTNLAKGKTVSASDDMPLVGELSMITDGVKDSPEYVELMDGVQWIQIDLEKSADIYAIALWHYHLIECVYLDVVIQVSDDPNFKTGVTTVFNNDVDNSSKLGKGSDNGWIETNAGKLIALPKPIKARYVRLYSNGNNSTDANHYVEVEIFGQ